jgi:cytochrome c biogenesis protein
MVGGVWGSVDGFEGQMSLVEGQTSNHVYIKNAVRNKNRLLDFSIKCHDIHIDTYENGSAKDYYSDLEVIDKNGKSILRKTIEVNEPLTHGGMSFYQANYGKQKKNEEKVYRFEYTEAHQKSQMIELSEYNDAFVIPGTKKTLQILDHNAFVQMPTDEGLVALGEAVRLIVADGGGAPETMTLFKDYPQLDAHLRPQAKDHFAFQGVKEKFELVEVTGLQVARDPGAPIVFLGCAVMVAGILWAFFTSHQKLWVNIYDERIVMGGRASRNPWGFKARFQKLTEEIQALS